MDVEACCASCNPAKGIIENRKSSKDATLLMDMIKDTLPLIEEEEKKALAPCGFDPGTFRLQNCRSNHFVNTTAKQDIDLSASLT